MDAEDFASLPHGSNQTGKTTATKWWPTTKGFLALGWTFEDGAWVPPPVEVQRG